ncbi:MAG: response regulator transcription factor [Caldilineaceae bacterium]|nr:response regulator transcription factor [Caldilineaceae bacterium]MCB9149205.1 response regulator transcription factor [Caldilineaceae bacterium]
MRILIIEDDKGISQVLKRGLEAHSHQIVIAARGEEGLDLATDETIELVLLDISLPGLNGHQVLEQLRARRPRMPVIMLTARDDLKNKIAALHAGADDYLTKPFAFEELLARIQAVMRRFDQPESARLQAGTLQLDLLAQRAWRNDNLIALSKREFALLEYFMRHPQQVLSREQILLGIWGYDFDTASNIVDVYVRQLRNKIDEPDQPSLIVTVRGAGYRFDLPTP